MKVAVIDMPWFNSKIEYLKSEGKVTYRPVLHPPPNKRQESETRGDLPFPFFPHPRSTATEPHSPPSCALNDSLQVTSMAVSIGGVSKQILTFAGTDGGAWVQELSFIFVSVTALKEHWLQEPGSGCVEKESWPKGQLSFCDQTERKLS